MPVRAWRFESSPAHNDPRECLNGIRAEHHCDAGEVEKAGACEASTPSREAGSRPSETGRARVVTESSPAH